MNVVQVPSLVLVLLLLGWPGHSPRPGAVTVTHASFVIPGLTQRQFVQKGDVNIGVLQGMSRTSPGKPCSDVLNSLTTARLPQFVAFAVDDVNKERLLPNNMTFGFAFLDDCGQIGSATAQSMAFVPQSTCPATGNEDEDTLGGMPSHDVVAVVGSVYSTQSVAVAHVLGPALVPQLSIFSTSDDLSNKELFPYFVRALPPDRFQFRAIFSMIQLYGWSYISVIYQEGSYGENGFKRLRTLFDQNGICLAAVHMVSPWLTDEEAEVVAKDLVAHKNALVVVLITFSSEATKVIAAAGRLLPAGSFIYVGSDGWAGAIPSMTHLGDHLLDTILVRPLMESFPEYEERFLDLKPGDTANPWFPDYWERLFSCSFHNGTCDAVNVTARQSNVTDNTSTRSSGIIRDAVYMLANATSRVLRSASCRDLTEPRAARACVTGPALLAEVKATRQNGVTGWLELDAFGDRMGRYSIKQVVAHPVLGYEPVTVAEFDTLTGLLDVVRNVSWSRGHKAIISSGLLHPPESTCSQPCGAHQARVVQEVTCCWLCQPCRLNERLVGDREGGSRCQACPPFSWPDPSTANTSCAPIPRDAPRLDSVQGCVQTAVALLSLAACLLVFLFFHRHRHCRVIKASSRELSFLMLLAIATGYVTMVTLLAPPGDLTCRLNFVLFCVSFTLIYGPLLVRALRIFRIFDASSRSARRPRWIDARHQLIFSFLFLAPQVVLCAVMLVVYPEWHRLTQRSPQDRYVELSCHFPLWGLTSFLAYNLALVAVCTLLAFKTRRLPDNFNESRFISMCVSTKLLILLCFIPAYLVSGRELLRMLMLALAVALNHSVALVFLFLPKIYAVLYLQGAADVQQTMQGGGTMITRAGAPGVSFGAGPSKSFVVPVLPPIGECHKEEGGGDSAAVQSCSQPSADSSVYVGPDVGPDFKKVHPMP